MTIDIQICLAFFNHNFHLKYLKLLLTISNQATMYPLFSLADTPSESRKGLVQSEIKLSQKRRVSFNERVVVYKHIHINDMTQQELKNTWLCRKECQDIKADCLQSVQMMMSENSNTENSVICTRGLRTPEAARLRQLRKYQALDAVLGEQDYQQINGIDDIESLARVYSKYSEECAISAHVVALQDEKYVNEHVKSQQPSLHFFQVKKLHFPKSPVFSGIAEACMSKRKSYMFGEIEIQKSTRLTSLTAIPLCYLA